MRLALLVTLLVVSSSTSTSSSSSRVELFFRSILKIISPKTSFEELTRQKDAFVERARSGRLAASPDYFMFLPKYHGTVSEVSQEGFAGACFRNIRMRSRGTEEGGLEVTVSLMDAVSLFCTETVIVTSGAHFHVNEYLLAGDHKVTFPPPATEAEAWDLLERGPRAFVLPLPVSDALANLAATAALFEPVLTQHVAGNFEDINRDFLERYAGIRMEERTAAGLLDIPAESVGNGDTFDILRLDGLDPMIAWGMGAATGHTAVAMWRDGALYVCESNAKTAYWPINGIQCSPYADWLEYASRADYNFVWAPLAEEQRAKLDMDAAWRYVDSVMGIDYGYEIVLTGLLDTLADNLPCAGPDGTHCLEPEHLEMVFSYVERESAEVARVFKPAMMQRAGVDFDRPLVEAYHAANMSGLSPAQLYQVAETDGWLYQTTRDGAAELAPVAICNVFVCNVWKAGGMFPGVDFECGETMVHDNYRLHIYPDEDARPDVCRTADPENPLCQVGGRYSLRLDSQPGRLPRFNYVAPVTGMFDSCPSKAPQYLEPTDC